MDKRALNPPTYYSFLVILLTMLLLLPVWSEQLPSSGRTSEQDEDDEESLGPLSQEEMVEIRERLMRSLGITRVPDVSKANVTAEERAEAYRIYAHGLQEMQRHRMSTRDLEHEEEPEEDEEEDKDGDEETPEVESRKYTLQATANSNGFSNFPVRLHFTLNIPLNSSKSPAEASVNIGELLPLRSATLRVLGLPNINPAGASRPRPPLVTLLAYQISGSLRTLVAQKRVVVLPDRQSGFESVDVTRALVTWPGWHEMNASIVMEVDCKGCDSLSETVMGHAVKNASGENATTASDISVGVNGANQSTNGSQDIMVSSDASELTSVDAFLDLVFDGSHGRRDKRDTRHKKKKANKRHKEDMGISGRTWTATVENADCKKRGKCCRRHRMFVTFSALQMDYVVEPPGFEAYYCKGKCPGDYNPAHTHALIQATMHALKKAPRPCCTPSKLSHLQIMHYDQNNQLQVSNWSNVVVDECACS